MGERLITEVSIYPVKPKNGLLGFASCLFEGKLSLNSIAIYTKPDGSGYRLVYPSKILPNGKQINLFYPIDRDIGNLIERAVIGKFEDLMKKSRESEEKSGQGKSSFA